VKWLAIAAFTVALTGCGGQTGLSSGAPPTVVCGTTLNNSAAGALVVDGVHNHAVVTSPSIDGLIFVQVSDGCSHGARVTWAPLHAADLVKRARARDGLDAAVVLRPATLSARFTVSARQDGAVVARVPIQLDGQPAGLPPS
jgi:hypothetical protein